MVYSDIPQKTITRIDQNIWVRNIGVIWTLAGLLGLITQWAGPMWLPLGIGCLILHYVTKTKYTVLSNGQRSIWIIQGKNHDAVLNEIQNRRKDQLKKCYGEINFENDPQIEINKFRWLAEEGVISERDAEVKISLIQERQAYPEESAKLLN